MSNKRKNLEDNFLLQNTCISAVGFDERCNLLQVLEHVALPYRMLYHLCLDRTKLAVHLHMHDLVAGWHVVDDDVFLHGVMLDV